MKLATVMGAVGEVGTRTVLMTARLVRKDSTLVAEQSLRLGIEAVLRVRVANEATNVNAIM